MKRKHIQHLYWRIGFGILPNLLDNLSKKDKAQIVNDLFSASKKITPIKIDTSEIEDLITESIKTKSKSNRKTIQQKSRKKVQELNSAWLEKVASTNALLREKMTLFWANHFVCQDKNPMHIQQYNNTLRSFALGNFKDFVKAVSKEAAMIKYLNTKQNRKLKPNENFARELMELFTLGIGNYTETDIKESARAFTGYNHNVKGDFVFRKFQHDNGSKTFLGKTGYFNGDDIIDIILQQKQCATFICEKIYKHFVNDTIDSKHIKSMVNVFYKDYNIEKLMRFVLTSNWFYDNKNIGTKIKSPIEFLVGIKTLVPIKFKNPKQLFYVQRMLGQILFYPPNVAGWKGGKSWIDSNTIMFRLKLPSVLLNGSYISKSRKEDTNKIDQNILIAAKKKSYKRFKIESDWAPFNTNFKAISIQDLEHYLMVCDINSNTAAYLKTLKKDSKKEYAVQLMSLPEYQMC